MIKAKIKEIFSSIQGEGPIVGYRQIFIRFCDCNLKCSYCDTDYSENTGYKEFTPEQLNKYIRDKYDLKSHHSISLTGGEPLLWVDFLKEFLPLVKNDIKIYLETNGTLSQNLSVIKEYINIIGADIKLKSASGQDLFEKHKLFFEKTKGTETFAKIVFDNAITSQEIKYVQEIAKLFEIPIVIQPKMIGDKMAVESNFCQNILDKFAKSGINVRLIPQVHKYLGVC